MLKDMETDKSGDKAYRNVSRQYNMKESVDQYYLNLVRDDTIRLANLIVNEEGLEGFFLDCEEAKLLKALYYGKGLRLTSADGAFNIDLLNDNIKGLLKNALLGDLRKSERVKRLGIKRIDDRSDFDRIIEVADTLKAWCEVLRGKNSEKDKNSRLLGVCVQDYLYTCYPTFGYFYRKKVELESMKCDLDATESKLSDDECKGRERKKLVERKKTLELGIKQIGEVDMEQKNEKMSLTEQNVLIGDYLEKSGVLAIAKGEDWVKNVWDYDSDNEKQAIISKWLASAESQSKKYGKSFIAFYNDSLNNIFNPSLR